MRLGGGEIPFVKLKARAAGWEPTDPREGASNSPELQVPGVRLQGYVPDDGLGYGPTSLGHDASE